MNVRLRILKFRRQAVEAKIEELIELLDRLDGDEDLEDDKSDYEPDGDERDTGFSEEEFNPSSAGARCDGSGVVIAERMLRGLKRTGRDKPAVRRRVNY